MKIFVNKKFGLMGNPDISVAEDKIQTVNLILYITNFLGALAISSAILEYYLHGIPISGFLYSVFYSPFLFAMIFRRRLSLNTISYLIISSGFLLAAYIMVYEGFYGATLIVFLTIVIFATLLLGIKEAVVTTVVCLLTITVAGYLYVSETLDIQKALLYSYKNWFTWMAVLFTFVMLSAVLALSIHRIHKKLKTSLLFAENKTSELSQTNEELTRIKKNLEKLVKERTKEIELKNIELIDSNLELKGLNEELERFNSLFVGREFRIKELRDKVKSLEKIIDTQ